MQEKRQEKSTVKQNILRFLAYKGVSAYEFYKESGVTRSILSQNNGISEDNIARFLNYAPEVNPTWLLTGRGDMLIHDDEHISEGENAVVYDRPVSQGLPYYDVDIAAGFDDFIDNPSITPTYYIDFKPYNHASFWCNVTGRSMEPAIHHGDIVALKEIRADDILYGEVYAVIMDEVRTIKIVRKGSAPDKIRLIPINTEEFDEQEFPISSIRAIYKVIGNMRPCF